MSTVHVRELYHRIRRELWRAWVVHEQLACANKDASAQ